MIKLLVSLLVTLVVLPLSVNAKSPYENDKYIDPAGNYAPDTVYNYDKSYAKGGRSNDYQLTDTIYPEKNNKGSKGFFDSPKEDTGRGW